MTRKPLLLARLAQRLRAQDWLAAGIEVTIVVLGVFLGFQVTEWNEYRQDRSRERSYMANVASDLRDDVAEMDENSRTAASRMAALSALLHEVDGWEPPNEYRSSRYAIKIEETPPFDEDAGYRIGLESFILSTLDGNRFAYNTLIAGDGLEIVRDKALLREVQAYYAAVDEVQDFERSLEDNRLRFVDQLQAKGVSAIGGETSSDLAKLVRADPALRATIENYWLYANRHVFLTRNLSAGAADLSAKIERSYGD